MGAEKSTSRSPDAGEGSMGEPEGGGGTASAGKGSVNEVMADWREMLAGGSSPRMEHACRSDVGREKFREGSEGLSVDRTTVSLRFAGPSLSWKRARLRMKSDAMWTVRWRSPRPPKDVF